jgi:carbon-monoxide dehydrogenase small subunit
VTTPQTHRQISVTVNGEPRSSEVEVRRTLADFLRMDLGLTGTHLGCEHGACGACTVVLDGAAVRSCLILAVQAEGHDVVTVEGVGSEGEMHPIQQALWENQAFQCGFCTPGFVMSIYGMVQEGCGPLSRTQIREELSGNICRCSGYQKIVDGVEAVLANGAGT